MTAFRGSHRPNFREGRRALTYDEYWEQQGLVMRAKLYDREAIICERIPKGSRVLVIGCGASYLPFALRDKGCRVTVSDIAPAAIGIFTAKGIPGFILDLENIDESSVVGKYDVVVASEVLEHIRNPERAIETLSKHAERFLISVPNSAFYRYRLHLMFSGRFFVQWARHPAEHLRYWSHRDFLEWLAAMDLVVQTAVPANGLACGGLCPRMKDVWPNLFAHQIVYDCRVTAPEDIVRV